MQAAHYKTSQNMVDRTYKQNMNKLSPGFRQSFNLLL